MGNVIESFASGLGQAIGKLFNSPIEFLSGKSCSSVCGPTWDFMCYIENFCIANILKLAMVFMLSYIVLLFFYLVHKLGICGCLCRSSCKMIWACFSSCFHVWEYSCTFLCIKLHNIRRTRRIRRRIRMDMNQNFYFKTGKEDYTDESLSYHFPASAKISRSISRRRDYKASRLRKSLQPRRHHARVEISRDLRCKSKRNHSFGEPSYTSNAIKHGNHIGTVNDIKHTQMECVDDHQADCEELARDDLLPVETQNNDGLDNVVNNAEEDSKWWDGESQMLSSKLVEALFLCNDLPQSQSPNRDRKMNTRNDQVFLFMLV